MNCMAHKTQPISQTFLTEFLPANARYSYTVLMTLMLIQLVSMGHYNVIDFFQKHSVCQIVHNKSPLGIKSPGNKSPPGTKVLGTKILQILNVQEQRSRDQKSGEQKSFSLSGTLLF